MERAMVRHYAARQPIFYRGDDGATVLAVLSGTVRISAPSKDGKEVVLNTICAGEVFGEIAVLDGGPRSADATAETSCELLVLERRDILAFLEAHPKVCIKLMEVLCSRLRRTTEQVEDVLFLEIPARLAKTLLRLARISPAAGNARFVRASQGDLGTMVAARRESINKHLREWQRLGIVHLRQGLIYIDDAEALHRIIAANEV
jgi:CRP-like cAMP-binding protein